MCMNLLCVLICVCVYLCVCVCVCVCVCARARVSVSVSVYLFIFVCVCIFLCTCILVCMYLSLSTYLSLCLSISLSLFLCVFSHAHAQKQDRLLIEAGIRAAYVFFLILYHRSYPNSCQTATCLPPRSLPNVQFQLIEQPEYRNANDDTSSEEGLEDLMFGSCYLNCPSLSAFYLPLLSIHFNCL